MRNNLIGENNPKVLFLSIYYNREDFVESSVKSMLAQSYNNVKLVIVDDCSTDRTTEKIEKVICNNKRVTFIKNKENKGFTNNLIDVIKEFKSEYIAIHGAGDISLPNRIVEQVEYLEKHLEVGVLSTGVTNVKKTKNNRTEISFNEQLKKNNITHGTVMLRRTAYELVGGYRSFFKTRQDKDLWYRMSFITKIHVMNKQLYTLTPIKNSVSGSAHKDFLPLYLSAFAKELALERKETGTDLLELYGAQGALFFNKKKSLSLIFRLFSHALFRFNFEASAAYFLMLLKVVVK